MEIRIPLSDIQERELGNREANWNSDRPNSDLPLLEWHLDGACLVLESETGIAQAADEVSDILQILPLNLSEDQYDSFGVTAMEALCGDLYDLLYEDSKCPWCYEIVYKPNGHTCPK